MRLFLLLLLFHNILVAQGDFRLLNTQLTSEVDLMKTLPNGNLLVAERIGGRRLETEVLIKCFSPDLELLWKHKMKETQYGKTFKLNITEDYIFWQSAFDGCDVLGGTKTVILDLDGNTIYQTSNGQTDGYRILPTTKILGDEFVMFNNNPPYFYSVILDLSNGLSWTLNDYPYGMQGPYEIKDFFILSDSTVFFYGRERYNTPSYFKLIGFYQGSWRDEDIPSWELPFADIDTSYHYQKIRRDDETEGFFAQSDSSLHWFNLEGQSIISANGVLGEIIDLQYMEDRAICLSKTTAGYEIISIDYVDLSIIDRSLIELPDLDISPTHFAVYNDDLYLSTAIPSDVWNIEEWEYRQLAKIESIIWKLALDNPEITIPQNDLRLEAVNATWNLHYTFSSNFHLPIGAMPQPHYRYKHDGIHFSFTNQGNTVIKELDFNAHWETPEFFSYCTFTLYQNYHQRFTNLSVNPGETISLTTTDFDMKTSLTDRLLNGCFWLTAPNQLLDITPSDNKICRSFEKNILPWQRVLGNEQQINYDARNEILYFSVNSGDLWDGSGNPFYKISIHNILGQHLFTKTIDQNNIPVDFIAGTYVASLLSIEEEVLDQVVFVKY